MPEDFVNHRENVTAVLNHSSPHCLPRGELFLSRTFLDVFFPQYRGDYTGQLVSAANLLGLSLVGVDLNEEWSRSLLRGDGYKRLRKYFAVGYINGPVLHAIAQLGFRQAMICVKKDHRSFIDLASRLIQDIEEICRMARENDMSALLVADDIAGNKGLLFSKNDFAMTVQPLYEQIADIIKKNDLNAFFHSDGDTRGVIEPLIEAGYDCIHPIDSQAGLDLYALKDYYKGRVSFMGHIDIITWSDERIALEIKDAERMFETGGLILGSTCGLSMKTVSRKLNVLYPRWQSGGQRA